jgi:hypothetical protein
MLKTISGSASIERMDPALERRLERLGLTGKEDEWTGRYLLCHHLENPRTAKPRQRFEAIAAFME